MQKEDELVTNQLRLYRTYQINYRLEVYVKAKMSGAEHSVLVKFWAGGAPINVQLGTYQDLPMNGNGYDFTAKTGWIMKFMCSSNVPLTHIRKVMFYKVVKLVGDAHDLRKSGCQNLERLYIWKKKHCTLDVDW